MSLPNYLAKIKSSGIYRFVFDKSEIPPAEAETMRLVVGYSEKGPFNTPVYIDNANDFITIFGNISKKLERKGIYFHRSALQALNGGPILALNVKPFGDEKKSDKSDNPDAEKVQTLAFNPAALDTSLTINTANKSTIKSIYDTNRFWYLDADQLPKKIGNDESNVTTATYISVATTGTKEDSCTLFIRKYKPTDYDITIREWYAANSTQEMPFYLEGIQDNKLNDYFAEVFVFRGRFTKDIVKPGGPFGYYKDPEDDKKETTGEVVTTLTEDDTTQTEDANWVGLLNVDKKNGTIIYVNNAYKDSYGEEADALVELANNSNSNFIARYQGCLIPYFKDANDRYISLDILFNGGNYIHKMLMKMNEAVLENASAKENGLAKIFSSATTTTTTPPTSSKDEQNPGANEGDNQGGGQGTEEGNDQEVTETPGIDQVVTQSTMLYADNDPEKGGESQTPKPQINALYFEGYTYKTINLSNDGKTIQKTIFEQLKDKGMRTALTNRVDVEYHYIVDTFRSYVQTNCKSILATIAKEKDNAFALLNFPYMADFVAEEALVNEHTYKFDITKLPEFSGFSLASESNGASWCAYYTAVVVSDGTLKETIPSVAAVSNNFMEKYGSRQPYYIVAGPTYGRLSIDGLVGPDYNYGRGDLDVLEPMGVNAIIYVPRKGTYINSNQTAKQVPVSGLSKIHIRELVIYLQDEIESMLQNYQWELNTQTLRDTIKAKADTILENVQYNNGIYAYSNVCDETNNPPEVIDNEMVILDTAIEPARGCGKMVQQLTIHRTGGITSATSNG